MISNKLFMPAIIVSLAGHGILLGLIGLHPLERGTLETPGDAIMVHLTEPPEPPPDMAGENKDSTTEDHLSIPSFASAGPWSREDTITLNTNTVKYQGYLIRLRKQIDRQWRYPGYLDGDELTKTVVVIFSITRRGECVDTRLLQSSGNSELDKESLRAVQSSAPFEELPERYNLARLNVVAEFNYGKAN